MVKCKLAMREKNLSIDGNEKKLHDLYIKT